MTMKYEFDKVISRKGTNALSADGYRDYLFGEYEVLNLPFSDDELLQMWVADMMFETAPEILAAVKKRLEHGILGYTIVADPDYVQSFVNWTQTKYNWKCAQEHIVTTQGVIPALYGMIGQLCKPDEKVLVLTPSYAFFKHAADHNEIELVTSDLIKKDGRYFMDFEDIRHKAQDEKVRMGILCNPHNPTGQIWTNEELLQFGEICLENGLTILSDEVHCDLLRAGETFTPLAKLFPDSDQIVTCMSPSKTFNLAGLMFANMVIPNADMRNRWKEDHIPVVNPLSLAANHAAYSNGQDWLDELLPYLDRNFEFLDNYLKQHLPEAKFRIPAATYLAWVDVSAYFSEETDLTYFFAKNAGVLLEGGKMFVANAEGHIRLNLACPIAVLEEGLTRIAAAIKQQKK